MSRKFSLIILFIVGFLTYLPSFGNQFVWDDEQFIYNNEYVKTFNTNAIFTQNTIAGAGESSNYYRPLTTLSFALDHALWGLSPLGFHLTNTLLHLGAGLLLYLILHQVGLRRGAFWISLFFIIHPVQTEAVTYINSRGDSFYAFLSFLSVYLWTLTLNRYKYRIELTDRTITLSSGTWSFLALATLIMSFFAKEIAVASVGIHGLVTLHYFITHQVSLKSILRNYQIQLIALCLFVLSSLGYLALRATVLNFDNSFNFYDSENLYANNLGIRILTFCKILFIYLKILVFPFNLHMERDTEIVTSLLSPWPWLALGIVGTLIAACIYEYKHKKTLWITLGSLWFLGMLLPVSGLIPINGLLYEHWLYLPMIGFFIAVLGFIKLIPRNLVPRTMNPATLYLTTLVFITLTLYQNYLWRAPVPFYEYTLKHAESARLHNNLGMAYDAEQKPIQAIEQYQASLAISNTYPQIYHNMGRTYANMGNFAKAEESFKKALEMSPNFDATYAPLIELYVYQKKYDQAVPLLEILITKYPNSPELQKTLVDIKKLQLM